MSHFWNNPYVQGISLAVLGPFAVWFFLQLKRAPAKMRERIGVVVQGAVYSGTLPLREEISALKETLLMAETWRWAILGIENPKVAVFRTNASGALEDISNQVSRWTGCDTADLKGDSWIGIVAPDDQDKVLEWWRRVSSCGSRGEMIQTYVGGDLKHFKVLVTAEPFFHPHTKKLWGHTGLITRLD